MKVLTAVAATVLLLTTCQGAVGPIRPDQHPSTRLQEAIRKMRLSLDHELIYLARAETGASNMRADNLETEDRQQSTPEPDDGFTDEVNTGDETFEPLRPGASVPPANEFGPTDAPTASDVPAASATPEASPAGPTTTPDVFTTQTPEPSRAPASSESAIPIPFPGAPSPDVGGPPNVEPTNPSEPFETPVVETFTPTETPAPVTDAPAPTPIVETPTPILTTPFPTEDVPTETPAETPGTSNEPTPLLPTTDGPEVSVSEEPSPEETGEVTSDPTTSPGTTPTINPAGEEEDDNVCFPSTSTVELEDGSVKKMVDVQLGDRVRVGPNSFSEVFMFTHKLANVRHSFVSLTTQSGHNLKLTKGHYLYVNGELAAADTVREGDFLTLSNSTVSAVTAVEKVTSTGLFNPQTVHGDIVVDGVRATTYTTSVEMSAAHSLLAPLRALYTSLGLSLSSFNAGANRLADLVPSGSLVA